MRARRTAGALALATALTTAPVLAQTPAATPADAALLARAMRLQAQVPLIDGHNDLPWEIREKGGSDLSKLDFEHSLPGQHTDIPRLKQGGVGGVFFAAYVPVDFAAGGAARVALEQIDLIHRMAGHSPELELATTAADVERIHRAGRIAALIGIEGGHAIENSLGTLRQFHALGVRYMTLTHANTIDWADAATDSAVHGGLTPFGEEVVREMNRLGMLVDLSHVSAETMRDAIRVARAPVIFSHSSAQAIADHPRNVPDDVLALLKTNGGVVMVNFFSGFDHPQGARLMRDMFDVQRRFKAENPNDPARADSLYHAWSDANPVPRGDVAMVADHIDHVVKVAGIDHVGIGSDFDGISVLPAGLEDVAHFPNLTVELLRRGYSDADVKKVLGLNILRVMREAEADAVRLQRERGPSTATIEQLDGPKR
ncbi:MAG TPA: dipeptidase [Longimicrobiaceae bacterium]|jgi:membrane dipeptidase|nr:dipeptidase [Longimicrobiaceae bacterium]